MGFAIWTFDMVKRNVPVGSKLSSESPDTVLYENCPEPFTRAEADERALYLSMRHGGVYYVRYRLAGGQWTAPTAQQWREGVSFVHQRRRELLAIARRKAQLKKLKVYYE